MSFAGEAAHAQGLCMHVIRISKEPTVMETDIPSASATTATFGEATNLRKDSQSIHHSSAATGLREELSRLKNDLDALMSHASTLTETELREARDRILARFSSMRYTAYGMVTQAGKQLSQGKNMTLDYVRNKPLQSLAIAAGAGLLLGMLIRRD